MGTGTGTAGTGWLRFLGWVTGAWWAPVDGAGRIGWVEFGLICSAERRDEWQTEETVCVL